MTKKFYAMFSLVAVFFATSANAQTTQVSSTTLRALEESTAVSPKSDRGCLDIIRRNDGSMEISNCAGWYAELGAGVSMLNWENNDGQDGDQLAVLYKASVGYRFMNIDWICALRTQVEAYANGPTSVEGLRQGFTAGFGATILAELFPHSPIRVDLGPSIKFRNLTSQKITTPNGYTDRDLYGGNVLMYGATAGFNIPLFKVFGTSSSLVNGHPYTIHRGVSVNLDVHASYMLGSIQKTWVDETHKVDFKEFGVTAGIQVKF